MVFKDKKKLFGYFCAIFGATAWGFSGICGQFLMSSGGLSSKELATIRLIFGGIILLLVSFVTSKEKTLRILKNKKDLITCAIFGIFGVLFSQFTYLTTIFYTNAPTATVLQFLSSILIVIGICIRELRFPKVKEVCAIFLAILGTFTLATHFNLNNLVINPLGLTWGIISAVSVVIYTLLPIEIIKKYGSTVATGYGMLIGGIVFSVYTKPWTFNLNLNAMTLGGIIIMVVVGTVLAYNMFLHGVSIIGPVRGSVIAGIEAVSAIVFSVLLLREKVELIDLFGMALIMLAITVLSLNQKN